MNFELICQQTIELVKNVGLFIKAQDEARHTKSFNIESKSANNFVTFVDKASEEKLVAGLQVILPEAGFIAEEGTSTKKGEKYNWIIDPVDGTTNFIHGLPPFAISVALAEGTEIVVGVVLEIKFDECFYAWKGSKAFLNGQEIAVSQASKVADSLVATGFPYKDKGKLPLFLETMAYFIANSHGIRRLGSAAIDMAYVACGRFDAFYQYGLGAWDVAAAALIIQQAGGKVSDFKGGDNYIFGQEIIATNALVFEEFKTVVDKLKD